MGLYSPWNSLRARMLENSSKGKGSLSLSLLQGIFPNQELNWGSCTAGGFFTSWATREAQNIIYITHVCVCVCVCVCVYTLVCFYSSKLKYQKSKKCLIYWFTEYHKLVRAHVLTQSCLILCNLMNYSPPGSSVFGIFQARILEWVAIYFSRGSPQTRNQISQPTWMFRTWFVFGPILRHIHLTQSLF